MDKIPMTAEGLLTLENELRMLRNDERPAIIQAIAVAREHGDLKENAEYHAARERQSFVEGRIAELEAVTSRADVIDVSKMTGNVVRFGATVMVADEDTDEEQTFRIVGTHEANLEEGKMAVTSPLAKAMVGKTIGDSVEVNTPRGQKNYEILDVKFG